jgi:16S rRNA processing protein RimM
VLVTVAHLRRTRGNKGELIADSLTSHPERFQKLSRVTLSRGQETREAVVESVWDFRGDPVFKFAGVDSISAAEPLAGFDVCVPIEERVQLGEGEYFFGDIVGCAAYEGDQKVGTFTGWQEDNAIGQVWFEVEEESGNTFLVPYNRAIFREIDVVGKVIRLDLPEGLRELN